MYVYVFVCVFVSVCVCVCVCMSVCVCRYVYLCVVLVLRERLYIIDKKVARSLQPFSKAHKYVHSYAAAPKYILGSVGTNSACPADYKKVIKDYCFAAARSAGIEAGAQKRNDNFLERSNHLNPFGCSVNKHQVTNSDGPQPIWNHDSSGQNDGNYRVVCVRGLRLGCIHGVLVICIDVDT